MIPVVRAALALTLACAALAANAQIYRWVDGKGTVHYSNKPPPEGVEAKIVDPNGLAGPPSPESKECYTLRCQAERMEERIARRQAEEERLAERRAEAARSKPRGMDFSTYISIERGMSEGELLSLAGKPDMVVDQGFAIAPPVEVQTGRRSFTAGKGALSLKTWTYLPILTAPFTTTVTLVGGRVTDVERVRKF